jgi:hypothetical protein
MLVARIVTDIRCCLYSPEDSTNIKIARITAGEVKMDLGHTGVASQLRDRDTVLI